MKNQFTFTQQPHQNQTNSLFSDLSIFEQPQSPSTPQSNTLFPSQNWMQNDQSTLKSESTNSFINQPVDDWPQWTVEENSIIQQSLMDIEHPMTDEEFQKYKKEKEIQQKEKEQLRLNRKQLNNGPINPPQYFNRGFSEPINQNHISYNRGMYHFVPQSQPYFANQQPQQQQQQQKPKLQQQQALFSNNTPQSNLFSNNTQQSNLFSNDAPQSNLFINDIPQSNPFSNSSNIFQPQNTQIPPPKNVFNGIQKKAPQKNTNVFKNSNNSQSFYSRSPFY